MEFLPEACSYSGLQDLAQDPEQVEITFQQLESMAACDWAERLECRHATGRDAEFWDQLK